MAYFNNHIHTEFSNLRLLDSTNKVKDVIYKSIEMGMSGIVISDHETLASHVRVNKIAKKLRETNPDFTIGLGNEIYLTDTREKGQKYYHFLICAKDAKGYIGLKELSSTAWLGSYYDKNMERVPLLKSELKSIMKKYSGHIIATTACIGGELGTSILQLDNAEKAGDKVLQKRFHDQIVDFLTFCIDVFGRDDFYLECAPSSYEEQILVNKRILKISEAFNLKICIGTDAHYLTKEDRFVHKSYLNSKGGEREVDLFYEFARLMEEDEVIDLLSLAFDIDTIRWIFDCSEDMRKKIEFFDLELAQKIVEVPVKHYKETNLVIPTLKPEQYQILSELCYSDNEQERYWVNECLIALRNKGLFSDERYILRLEEEARVKKVIGEKLGTCMFAYPNTLQHYIDLFWDCGSTVGAGRGSACAGLNHYLLGITQLDPIEYDLPWWRYMNDERIELGDIDIDLAPSKIQKIFAEIRKERGELGLVQVCTFGTEGTKSTILTACRGYRGPGAGYTVSSTGDYNCDWEEIYKDGIDVDIAQYMSSLIPQER